VPVCFSIMLVTEKPDCHRDKDANNDHRHYREIKREIVSLNNDVTR